jgi:uncharacterized paraquat-inducible protein A
VADAADLIRARCVVHARREAAARCPECRRFFCRECVTEHGDRAICAACLDRLARTGADRRRTSFLAAARAGQVLLGIVAAWFFFYMVGEFLSSLPDTFHETSRGTGAPGPP